MYNWTLLHKYPAFSREHVLIIQCHYYPNFKKTVASLNFQELFNLSSENIVKINRLDNKAFHKIINDDTIDEDEDKYKFNFKDMNTNLINEYTYNTDVKKDEIKPKIKKITPDNIIKNDVVLIDENKYKFNFKEMTTDIINEDIKQEEYTQKKLKKKL